MGFVRAEVAQSVKQYQEALWGALAVCVGLAGALTGGFITLISIPVIIAGSAIIYLGTRRARYQSARAKSPISDGVVEVVEQELTFFSSGIGASIAMEQVVKIEIETNDQGPEREDMYWVFYQRSEPPVRIPSGAVGGDELFDALVAFPGASYEKVIEATQSTTNKRFLIWLSSTYITERKLH